MSLMKLHSDIQANPKNLAAYRKIVEIYRKAGLDNEAIAFEKLIQKKFHDNSPTINQKQ